MLKSLPEKGDPYQEIYPRADVWWGLFRRSGSIQRGNHVLDLIGRKYLAIAKEFHQKINATYHPVSYAHYGRGRQAAGVSECDLGSAGYSPGRPVDALHIIRDDTQGTIHLTTGTDAPTLPIHLTKEQHDKLASMSYATLRPPMDPGDQTVRCIRPTPSCAVASSKEFLGRPGTSTRTVIRILMPLPRPSTQLFASPRK